MAVTGVAAVLLVVARVLFGGVLAFMGLNHFLDTDGMTEYAAYKGVPAPRASVLASGAVLVAGGAAIVLGVYPAVVAVALAAFLLFSAVLMHDFWAVPEEETQDEMTHFLKNAALAGGALAVAVVATEPWAYDLGLRLV